MSANPLQLFDAIPLARENSAQLEFADYDLCDTYFPPVYTLNGGQLKLNGPIRVLEMKRRKRVRFVKVEFFEWHEVASGVVPKKYMSCYAWQGDHCIHLLEEPDVLSDDPFAETTTDDIDRTHLRLVQLSGETDGYLDVL